MAAKDAGDPALQWAMASLNLMRLLHDSSPCQTLEKLPKDLSGKLPNIRKTGSLLHQMPSVVISLDTSLEHAIQSAKQLEDVKKLLVPLRDSAADGSSAAGSSDQQQQCQE